MSSNKVIGSRGQGVGEECPRELTTEHLKKASLRLDKPLPNSLGLWPISCLGTEKSGTDSPHALLTFGIWPKMGLNKIDCWQLKRDRMVLLVISEPLS